LTLEEILGDEEMLRKKSLAACRGTEEHFNIARQTAKMIDAYRTLLTS
jgi:hypothetical protein